MVSLSRGGVCLPPALFLCMHFEGEAFRRLGFNAPVRGWAGAETIPVSGMRSHHSGDSKLFSKNELEWLAKENILK
jgi:hypothetical protein